MKTAVLCLWLWLPLVLVGQTTTTDFDLKKWEPPYSLGFPEAWEVERFPIPIGFAPQIPYNGVEDIRFMPGWAKTDSPEYWSYAFLWFLEGRLSFNATTLENNLHDYFTGLGEAMRPAGSEDNLKTVKTIFRKGKKQKGDLKTFFGSVYMLDYKSNKPIALYVKVHFKNCPGQNKTLLFFELSPKHYTHPLWSSLDGLWSDFRCDKPLNIK